MRGRPFGSFYVVFSPPQVHAISSQFRSSPPGRVQHLAEAYPGATARGNRGELTPVESTLPARSKRIANARIVLSGEPRPVRRGLYRSGHSAQHRYRSR